MRAPIPFFCLFLLHAACRQDDPPDPVFDGPIDRVYRTTVERLENTCDRDWLPETWTDLYDVRPRHDGLYDLAPYMNGDEGWPLTFEGVQIEQGAIDHRFVVDGVVGTVDRDALDLEMTFGWSNQDGTPCAQRTRVRGEPWPVTDAASIEGTYLVRPSIYSDTGRVCDGLPQSELMLANELMLVSRQPDGQGRISFAYEGFRMMLPIQQGIVSGMSPAWLWYSFIGWYETTAEISGIFGPGGVDVDLKVADPFGGSSSCYYRYRFVGKKTVPGVGVSGDYLGDALVDDTCTPDPPWERGISYTVIDQDGWVELIDVFGLSTWLLPQGGAFSASVQEGAGTATYDGSVAPGTLEFSYTFKSDYETRDCHITREVATRSRFID